ncbi:MAG TPA: hypothetical protein VGC58_00465 [Candidatus Paceibacterota bacterium]
MFNLLPDSFKEDLTREYHLRRFIIVLFFVIFIQISFFILMLPSWVTSLSKEKEVTLRVEKMNESPLISSLNMIKPTIKALNSEIILMDRYLDYPEAMPFFSTVLSKKETSIKINQFSYTAIGSSTATISLQGFSATRDSLVEFKKSLDDLKIFKSVDLPISNYAKDRDINFSMTINIANKI